MPDGHTLTLHNRSSAEHRAMTGEIRKLIRLASFPGARRDLLELAARFDRKADHFDSREPPILPAGV